MTLTATCHCGATKITLPRLPASGTQCNCSFCARTGAVWAYFAPGELQFDALEDDRAYSATGMNQHHFCGSCGVHTWGDSPDWASMYNADGTSKNGDPNAMPTSRIFGINLRLVDDLDWSTLTVEQVDGRNNW
jgi:hypothetical protein